MIKRVLLVGNPNCGKTTLFNALTASQQKVGNWPGVTIEKKAAPFHRTGHDIEIIDLPGVYSLGLPEEIAAKDAKITAQIVAEDDIDLIINVVDACHLERHLFLTSQLLELGKPLVLAINMMDLAERNGVKIDAVLLAKQLHCPVVTLQAHRHIGLEQLEPFILGKQLPSVQDLAIHAYLPPNVLQYIQTVQQQIRDSYPSCMDNSPYYAFRRLEQSLVSDDASGLPIIEDLDVIMADARYQLVHSWVSNVLSSATDAKEQFTAKLDRVLLHRYGGLPIFFAFMYAVFFLAIGVGGAVQSGFDKVSQALFMQAPAWVLMQWHAPAWLIQLTAFGFGQAAHTLATFIPVLAIMYFLLSFLEASGYMARVAFIMDRAMRSLGLPGQAFVPMIIGFGCNVPAILAARTLQTERERFLTVLMNPYMSCSARLAIYAVFVAAFFPNNGYQIIFSLYLIGIGMGVLTAYLARRTFLPGSPSPMILELPTYHCPNFYRLSQDAGRRLRYFLNRAGKVIVPLCLVLSFITIDFTPNYLGLFTKLGSEIMPFFSFMGIDSDNWPAVISLFTGMLAKEVVIGTLGNLYSQMSHLGHNWQSLMPVDFWQVFQQAFVSIYEHLHRLVGGSGLDAHDADVGALSSQLRQHFISPIAAYAYLLFILLYIPCVSTMAAIRQEASRRLMWFSISWSIGLAYTVAVLFYQIATRISPFLTTKVVDRVGISLILLGVLCLGWRYLRSGGANVVSNS